MNGNSDGAPTDQKASQPTPEELDREPDAAAGAAQQNDKPSPGGGEDSSADGPEAIDLDSVHDRAS